MRKIFLIILIVISFASCKLPSDKISELKTPVILIGKSTQMGMDLKQSIHTVMLRGADGEIITLSNCVEAASFYTYEVNDTIIK